MAATELRQAIDADSGLATMRSEYLDRHVRALQTSLRILEGENLSLVEEAEKLYNITPEWQDEQVFLEAQRALDEYLPPGENLNERAAIYRDQMRVDLEWSDVERLFNEILAELRRRTQQRFPLPSGDSFELRFVSDQPWEAYNWYLGECRSRIDFNTDAPLYAARLVDTMAHEGYPGHHTEHCLKEDLLWRQQRHSEHCVQILHAPMAVVSEGIATRALKILIEADELAAWQTEEIFPRADLPDLDAYKMARMSAATESLEGIAGNAAFLMYEQGASDEEVVKYYQKFGLTSEEGARRAVRFLRDPLFRSYVFTYFYGARLLDELISKRGDQDLWFARLLTEPVTPSQIVHWIEEGDGLEN